MSLFLRYPLRSLARGGQRTLLALFCVAVGVMAIVGVQLAGVMVSGTLLSSVREINGGDVSLSGEGQSWSEQEIGQLDQLRQQGVISDWTAITDLGLVSARRECAVGLISGLLRRGRRSRQTRG